MGRAGVSEAKGKKGSRLDDQEEFQQAGRNARGRGIPPRAAAVFRRAAASHAAAGRAGRRVRHTGEDHFAHDKAQRIAQLDDFLKNGIIDKAEYRTLRDRYERNL